MNAYFSDVGRVQRGRVFAGADMLCPDRRRRAVSRRLLMCVAASALALSACGSTGPSGSASASASAEVALLTRLAPQSGGLPAAVVVDVEQVRSLLGLPSTAPAQASASDSAAEEQYAQILAAAIPQLAAPAPDPAVGDIDFGDVTALANNGLAGPEQVLVLATSQSFPQLASALTGDGYTSAGSVLENPNTTRRTGFPVIAGGSGVIALGSDPDAVEAVADGHAAGIHGVISAAVTDLGAPVAEVIETDGLCFQAMAMADDIAGQQGELLVLAKAPQTSAFTAPEPGNELFGGVNFSPATVSGGQLTGDFTYPSTGNADSSLLSYFLNDVRPQDVYNCP